MLKEDKTPVQQRLKTKKLHYTFFFLCPNITDECRSKVVANRLGDLANVNRPPSQKILVKFLKQNSSNRICVELLKEVQKIIIQKA